MNTPAPRAPLGFGGAVGLGAAVALLVIVIAVGHAVLGQVEGAVRVVIVFAEIALCTLLAALAVAVLVALVFGAQFARQHLADRRAASIAAPPTMRAEAIEDGAEVISLSRPRPAIQGKQPWTVPPAELAAAREDEWL
jgi:hypothetical protein